MNLDHQAKRADNLPAATAGPSAVEHERGPFEAWAHANRVPLVRCPQPFDGGYKFRKTRNYWIGWQACANWPSKPGPDADAQNPPLAANEPPESAPIK